MGAELGDEAYGLRNVLLGHKFEGAFSTTSVSLSLRKKVIL
jgi:hypothetical protein